MWDLANKAREEWESETGSRTTQAPTSSSADTHLLVYAVGSGKGLKVKIKQKTFQMASFLKHVIRLLKAINF